MAEFAVPVIHVNHASWGPSTLPEQYVGVPFNPFGKGDDIGRAADFTTNSSNYRGNNRRWNNYKDADPSSMKEDDFQIVEDLTTSTRSRGSRSFRGRFSGRGRFTARRGDDAQQVVLKGKQAKYLVPPGGRRGARQFYLGGRGGYRRYNQRNIPALEASVKIHSEWEATDRFEISALIKATHKPPTVSDLKTCGQVFEYNKSFESTSGRQPVSLKRDFKVTFDSVSTMDDPVIQEYAADIASKENPGKVVFATDEIMAHIMTCPRTSLPWDVYFTSVGNGLVFIDKREDSNLHLLSVNETLSRSNWNNENEKVTVDKIDEPAQLSIEATAVNQNFSQQVVKKVPGEVDVKKGKTSTDLLRPKTNVLPNPFWDEEDAQENPEAEPAPFAYKYRKFDMEDMSVIARTEVHAWTKRKATKEKGLCYMTCYALNEANNKITNSDPWKKTIDNHRGQVVATEMKNNAFKVGKWAAQSLLAGADLMKIGYVSRNKVNSPFNHSILATQFYTPVDFATQINLREASMWGIFRTILNKVYQMPPGRFVLMKDPNKPSLQLFKVPDGTFDREDSEDEDEEEQ